jgi:hypothetical protein
MLEIAKTCIIGAAMAAAWFYIRTLLSGEVTKAHLYRWLAIIVPLGIVMAFGMKIMGWL